LAVFLEKKVSTMTKRLITGTAGERGRRIFIQPADGSMKLLSYGRIRLNKKESEIRFSNDGQETGLICLNGTCVVKVGNESFEMKRDDALYVPKCSTIAICTEQEVDVLECSAPVDGQYLLQFVAAESVRMDEKLHLVAGTDGARREINILLGSNIQAGRLIVGVTRSLPGNWTS
jgi:5-deoxy-glucuronate isomerase